MIKIKAINTVSINDLGISLNVGEETSLDYYEEIDLLKSTDLRDSIESGDTEVYIDTVKYSYPLFIDSFVRLNKAKHEVLDTLKHSLSETSFMQTTKVSGKVSKITYYTDSSMILKIREEEVIRDNNGKSQKIIITQYDDLGTIVYKENQNLNRGTSGGVQSITTTMG